MMRIRGLNLLHYLGLTNLSEEEVTAYTRELPPLRFHMTILELGIVLASITIVSALIVPNFLDNLQKAKQKKTVADIRNVGTAYFSWITDQVGAAAAGQQQVERVDWREFHQQLKSPQLSELLKDYIQTVPATDGWHHAYDYDRNDALQRGSVFFGIRSPGRNGKFESDVYNVETFNPTQYDEDIVWVDGFFVQWPGRSR